MIQSSRYYTYYMYIYKVSILWVIINKYEVNKTFLTNERRLTHDTHGYNVTSLGDPNNKLCVVTRLSNYRIQQSEANKWSLNNVNTVI